ncbi:mechanosensitive ion channel domain-containing protein [Candidatus Magnetaquicoccus inordinatus]|uniref:mechanosensitive ion channel domain-containing protein n=1 Tax=Candidatus Magnetaquicoccus inordinatus TaxID=2496818 RepID=UPI00102C042C|nr:mechanosensitive ion channel domain-containing protein [Candidatus Magnetaquicoccus inordinatus]
MHGLFHLLLMLALSWLLSGELAAAPRSSTTPAAAPTATATAAAPLTLASLWESPTPTPSLLRSLLEGVNTELNGLPKESKEEAVEQQRALLQKRVALLQEFLETMERLQTLRAGTSDWKTQEETLKKNLERLAQQPPPKAPDKPTPEAFKQVQESLEKSIQAVDALTAQAKELQLLLGQIPEKTITGKGRLKQAQDNYQQFRDLSAKAEGNKKRSLTLQAENAHIELLLAQNIIARWEAEQNVAMAHVTLHDKQLEVAQNSRQYQQKVFSLYQEALNNQQAAAVTSSQELLRRKELAAQQASSPEDKFLSGWELSLARLQKEQADLNKLQTEVVSAASEQEHLLQNEKSDLKSLETLTQQFGTQGLAADILKENYKRLKRRRWDLREPLYPELLAQLRDLQSRIFVVDSALAELSSSWAASLAELQQQLAESKRESFTQQATQLRNSYRQLLSDEKRLLFDLQAEGQRLQLLTLERTNTLQRTENFLLSRIFWIQDAPPPSRALLQQLSEELLSSKRNSGLNMILQHAVTEEQWQAAWRAVQEPWPLLTTITLLVLLPPLLWQIQRSLRRLATLPPPDSKQSAASLPLRTILVTLLLPVPGPAWLALLVLAGQLLPWPAALLYPFPPLLRILVTESVLIIALFWLLWSANKLLFAPGGLAERLLGLPLEVTQSLLGSIRLALWAYLLFLPLWVVFRAPPFHYEVLPRLGYTLFECTIAWVIYRLIHPNAPLPRHALAHAAPTSPAAVHSGRRSLTARFTHHWWLVSRLLSLFMVVVVLLDLSGYRFGATWLAYNGIRSILTFFLLIGVYRLLASTIETLIRRRRRAPTVLAPGARGTLSRTQIARQINDSLRMLFILAGLLLLGNYWGVHEQIFQALKGLTIFSTTGSDGQLILVSLVDLLRFVITLLVVGWIVKHLPRIYELLLYSWLSLDAGSRYAVLTISRYLIFIIGLLSALNELHLDVAKVGWLVAAISVGIGFGLQEIVANFVSGIILLLERPVRVGDMITIGNSITGRITRINIRATTVVNTDYQEQLIPNRDLITKEVTNWTLANTTLRIVIKVGVAYGSDVEQVKRLLLELALQQQGVLAEPAPEALFMQHGASSLDFELWAFLPDPALRWVVRDRLNTAISQTFAKQGIEIPFPQQEVRIRKEDVLALVN